MLKSAVALAALLVLLFTSVDREGLLDEVVGAVLVVGSLIDLIPVFRGRRAGAAPLWRTVAVLVSGLALLLWPAESTLVIGRLAALVLAVFGLSDVMGSIVARRRSEELGWRMARAALLLVMAGVVALFPEATVQLVLLAVIVVWIFNGVVAVAHLMRTGETGIEQEITPDDTEKIVAVWLRRHGLNDQGRTIVTEKLFIEGPEFRQRLGRFAVLMGLATVIATFGVATGSTAVVIGGMLIAPLMMPILALSAALLHGWTRRAVVASLVVLGGVAGTTLLAFLLARAIPDLTAVLANDQVLSRTSPSLLDLAIAVAAGTAGAYAVTRPDVSDALPGVAVAISLVPPLTVAGVTLQGREFGEALGALLLFATNLVSILVMASIVFLLTGYVTWERVKQQRRQLRSSYATVAIGFIVVTAALAITGQQVLEDAARTRSSESIVEEWLGVGSAFQLISIDLDGGDVNVSVRGEGDPPPAETLHRLLVEGLSDDVVLRLRVLPETLITIGDA